MKNYSIESLVIKKLRYRQLAMRCGLVYFAMQVYNPQNRNATAASIRYMRKFEQSQKAKV